VLAPATLAALPSTRAIPDRDVFYACHDEVSTKVGRFPQKLHSLNRDVFYVAHPIRSIHEKNEPTSGPLLHYQV
jgi:hypothetical protein